MTIVTALARLAAMGVIAGAAISGIGCNQRAPVLDSDVAITAPSTTAPSPPTDIARLTFLPPGNRGGTTGVGRVLLDSPAPDGGRLVSVQSANESIVTVSPGQILIPAGSLSADFQFTTRAVPREVNVTITASSGGITISDYVSVWTTNTQFLAYAADRSGVIPSGSAARWSSDAGTQFEIGCDSHRVFGAARPPSAAPISVSFGAPQGQPLRTGIYSGAASTGTGNRILVDGLGQCTAIGSFEVREFELRANGTPSRLWVTFEQGCRERPGVIRGAYQLVNPRVTTGNQCLR